MNEIDDLLVGVYSVQVEDGQGCLYDMIFVIEVFQLFGSVINVVQFVCDNIMDGLINVIVI